MKITIYIFTYILLLSYFCNAQEITSINVNLSTDGSYKIDPQKDLYYLPITFIFDKDNFKDKKITFYSENKASKKIVDATFESSDLGHTSDGEKSFYQIKLNPDSTIKLKDNKTKLTGTLFFKIENGNFSSPIKFEGKKVDLIVGKNSIEKSPIVTSYIPGSILMDAIKLNELKVMIESGKPKADEKKLLDSILGYYQIYKDPDLRKNKFLIDVLGNAYNLGSHSGSKGDSRYSLSSASSFLGGLDVTNIADGFAKFIVKRTKQELSIAFFEKFKTDLDSFPDIKSVFPQTSRALSAIDKDIYMYQAYIQTLRESFENDLASLPTNLPTIIDNHQAYFDRTPDLKASLLSSFYFAQAVQDKQHPGNIIENFPVDNFDQFKNLNIKPAFQTLILVSGSLKSNTGSDRYWARFEDMKQLYSNNDETVLKIYLGLLEQKAKMEKIIFNGTQVSLWKIIDNSHDSLTTFLPKYKAYIRNFTQKAQSLEAKIYGLNKIRNDSLLFENYYSVVSSSIDLMRSITQVENLPMFPKHMNLQHATNNYFDLAQTASDIAIDVNRRNYASAVVNTVHIYDLAISKWNNEKEAQEAQKRLNQESPQLAEQAIQNGFLFEKITIKLTNKQINNLQPDVDRVFYYNAIKKANLDHDAIKQLFKYGTFMATIVQAKNSDDVEAAIEAITLPTGSARIKRETNFNVALNAYCGFYAGHEEEKFSFSNGRFLNSFGVTAPIGLSISWGHSLLPFTHGIKWGTSSTIFFSVVDLGAITSFRFVDDTTKTLSKIELKDIISPGIFLSWGIPKSPISINLGYQITPYLREVKASENSFKTSYSRFSVSVCVDLHLLNFYTKPKD